MQSSYIQLARTPSSSSSLQRSLIENKSIKTAQKQSLMTSAPAILCTILLLIPREDWPSFLFLFKKRSILNILKNSPQASLEFRFLTQMTINEIELKEGHEQKREFLTGLPVSIKEMSIFNIVKNYSLKAKELREEMTQNSATCKSSLGYAASHAAAETGLVAVAGGAGYGAYTLGSMGEAYFKAGAPRCCCTCNVVSTSTQAGHCCIYTPASWSGCGLISSAMCAAVVAVGAVIGCVGVCVCCFGCSTKKYVSSDLLPKINNREPFSTFGLIESHQYELSSMNYSVYLDNLSTIESRCTVAVKHIVASGVYTSFHRMRPAASSPAVGDSKREPLALRPQG